MPLQDQVVWATCNVSVGGEQQRFARGDVLPPAASDHEANERSLLRLGGALKAVEVVYAETPAAPAAPAAAQAAPAKPAAEQQQHTAPVIIGAEPDEPAKPEPKAEAKPEPKAAPAKDEPKAAAPARPAQARPADRK